MNATASRGPVALFGSRALVRTAIVDAFAKLDPRLQVGNPVMFVVYAGSWLTSVIGWHPPARVSSRTQATRCRSPAGCG